MSDSGLPLKGERGGMDKLEQVYQYIDSNQTKFVEELCTLIAQPSVSARDEGVNDCAHLLESMLSGMGFRVATFPTHGHPAIVAEMDGPKDSPTVLIYGHYDVQPPEPLEMWKSPPFTPTIREGRIYGRGAGDNKGQFYAQIAAISSITAVSGGLPVNVKVLLEGDEEQGSPYLADFLREHREQLKADLAYTSDAPIHSSGRPLVIFGVRGLLCIDLNLRGPNRDLHSGNYGGPVPNPAWGLVHLLASMKDAEGNVLVEGFYDDVVPPTLAEREVLKRIPFDPQEVQKSFEISRFEGPEHLSYYEKLMFRPTLNICGLSSGYSGGGVKTILPSTALAKLDIRLVVNQDPDRVFECVKRHLLSLCPDLEVKKIAGVLPSKTAIDHRYAQCAVDAVARVWGEPPVVFPTLGGTLPDYVFTRILGVPSILVPYANPEENNHSPNENISLDCFNKGIKVCATFLYNFASTGK
jgi:acetylornithine deacetylase/succinyl-diaminopimelate desuccinylase-like protein